jgi:hypothetical protein
MWKQIDIVTFEIIEIFKYLAAKKK